MAAYEWLGTATDAWATAGNWNPSGPPSAIDHVRCVANAVNGIAGTDLSGTALGDFIVEEGFAKGLGSVLTSLKIDPDRFEFNARGSTASYVHLHTAAITALIRGTASANVGYRGLYLEGTGLTTVAIEAGKVGLASRVNDTGTITTISVSGNGADVWMGKNLSLTTANVSAGQVVQRCAATTVNVYGGTLRTEEEGAITTMNVYGGMITSNSTGTIGTLHIFGGTVDFLGSALPRTVNTINLHPGGRLFYDPAVMTFGTINEANAPIKITTSRA